MLIKSVVVDDRLVSEFGPEMALFRVDTIAKNHEGQPTIERVRVNKKQNIYMIYIVKAEALGPRLFRVPVGDKFSVYKIILSMKALN